GWTLTLEVGVELWVGVEDWVGVDDCVGVEDWVGVDDCVGVEDWVGVDDCVGVDVWVGVPLSVGVIVGVPDPPPPGLPEPLVLANALESIVWTSGTVQAVAAPTTAARRSTARRVSPVSFIPAPSFVWVSSIVPRTTAGIRVGPIDNRVIVPHTSTEYRGDAAKNWAERVNGL